MPGGDSIDQCRRLVGKSDITGTKSDILRHITGFVSPAYGDVTAVVCQKPGNLPPQPAGAPRYKRDLAFERQDGGGICHCPCCYQKPNAFSIDDLRILRQYFLRVSRLDMA
jgi:hypothetical protein